MANLDHYLPCADYAGKPAHENYPGFLSWFNDADGQWYFAAVTDAGRVVLRSEGYESEAGRNNGIESVMRNRDIESRYKVVQDESDGQWYISLRAGNHQEIARSCGYENEAAALAGVAACFSTFSDAKTAAAPAVIEDYLPCEAYADKEPTGYQGFTGFTHPETGLHYFAMVDDDGRVILKSEGYVAPASRDNGIESVLRNRGIPERWVERESEHGHYMSLRAGNNQEIARSCTRDSAAALAAWWAPFAAAGLWGAAKSAPAPPAVEPAMLIPPAPVEPKIETEIADEMAAAAAFAAVPPAAVPSKTAYAKADDAEAAPPPITNYTAAPGASGSDWWKWLLPLLLLALLMLLLAKYCKGCKNDPAATSAIPAPAMPAPVDTLKSATAPMTAPASPAAPATAPATAAQNPAPPPPAPTCSCDKLTDPVFDLPSGRKPQSLPRLGTNPEFGNSHGLSPTEFYEKLKKRHAENAVDKRFLERMFRAMGYANGFADARAEQFSAVEIAPGTVGNMGYSAAHKTVYASLDAAGKDLLAFRIKAANGCDLHFMKTCGNHFFFCPK
ncbi:MAG: DUF1508 domain-containing protein [Saprospiraceae bacterium]